MHHFVEKFAQIIQIILSKRPVPDLLRLFRIQPGHYFPDPTASGSITLAQGSQSVLVAFFVAFLAEHEIFFHRLNYFAEDFSLTWTMCPV
jgi:hypothetical protein